MILWCSCFCSINNATKEWMPIVEIRLLARHSLIRQHWWMGWVGVFRFGLSFKLLSNRHTPHSPKPCAMFQPSALPAPFPSPSEWLLSLSTLTMNSYLNQLGHFWPKAVLCRAHVETLFALSDIIDGQRTIWKDCVSQILVNRHKIPLFATVGF